LLRICVYAYQTVQSLAGSSRQMFMVFRMTATIAKILTDILSGMRLTLPWMYYQQNEFALFNTRKPVQGSTLSF